MTKKSKVFIFNEKFELLLLSTGDKWELPGGRKNTGERADQTARREVTEETGMLITDMLLVDSMSDGCSLFVTRAPHNNVVISSEHDKYKWVNTRKIKKLNLTKKTTFYMKMLSQAIDLVDQLT